VRKRRREKRTSLISLFVNITDAVVCFERRRKQRETTQASNGSGNDEAMNDLSDNMIDHTDPSPRQRDSVFSDPELADIGGSAALWEDMAAAEPNSATATLTAKAARVRCPRVVEDDVEPVTTKRSSWSRRLWLAGCLLLAGFLAFGGPGRFDVEPDQGPGGLTQTAAESHQATPSVPIEQVRAGQRVLSDDPDVDLSEATQVDPATWRRLHLRAETTWDDGTLDTIEVETLQPPDWIAAHGASLGASVPLPLDLVEMGLPADLTAEVVADEPCPPIAAGPGRVVLTTVNHLNRDVLELTLKDGQGSHESLRPTGLHKFYSIDRDRWLSAEALQPGETLRGHASPLTLVETRRIPGVHRVYNMTVEGEHVYFASTLGVLAHNIRCGVTDGGGARRVRFVHGTHVDSAADIATGGLNASKAARKSAGGKLSRPGAFDAHPIGPPGRAGPGLEDAYNFSRRHALPSERRLLIGEIDESLFMRLVRERKIEVSNIPGVDSPQWRFLPDAFDDVNSNATWSIFNPKATR